MKISIEWFLLDNTAMNYAIFACAAAIGGIPIRHRKLWLFSFFGAVYALLSLFYLPLLLHPIPKIGFFLALGLPLYAPKRGYWKAIVLVLLSASLIGGLTMLLSVHVGGIRFSEGVLFGSRTVRIGLFAVCLAFFLPRWVRDVQKRRETESLFVPISVCFDGEEVRLTALVDTGNLLLEPISHLPVVLTNRAVDGTQPILMNTASGGSILYAKRIALHLLCWDVAVDCWIATVSEPISDADAVLPSILLPYHWRCSHVEETSCPHFAALVLFRAWQRQFLLVRSHKGESSSSALCGGRNVLHRSRGGGQSGKRKAHRT